ncbi:DEAD/DEAH box helicase [Gordonia sp. NPDC003424]
MPDYAPLVLDDDELIAVFGRATVERGSAYAAAGMIYAVAWSANGLTLNGTSHGSGGARYTVAATFSAQGRERYLMQTRCTCPVGADCKHGVALLLTEGELYTDDYDYDYDEDDYDDDPEYSRSLEALGRSVVAQMPAQWRTALRGLIREEPPGSRAPIGIQFLTPPSSRYMPSPGLSMRLVTPGKRDNWIRTGISWSAVEQSMYMDSGLSAKFEAAHLKAIRSIVRCAATAGFEGTLSLSSVNADIWELLVAARDAGVEMLADPSTGAETVDFFSASRLALAVVRDDEGVRVRPYLQVDADPWHPTEAGIIGSPNPHGGYAVSDGVLLLGPFETSTTLRAIQEIMRIPDGVLVPDSDVDEFATEMLPTLSAAVPVDIVDNAIAPPTVDGPTPLLTIHATGEGSLVSWKVRYLINGRPRIFGPADAISASSIRDAEEETRAWKVARPAMELVARRCARWQSQATRHLNQARVLGAARDQDLEAAVASSLDAAVTAASLELLAKTYTYSPVDTAVLIGELVPELGDDVAVEIIGAIPDYRPAQADPLISIGEEPTTAGNDWLNLAITVDVDGHRVPLGDIVRDIALGATHLILPDGTYFPLDTPELKRLAELIDEAKGLGEVENGLVRRDTYNATLWEELLSLGVVDEQLAEWHERLTRLATATIPASSGPPPGLQADLRDYQGTGLDWLRFLWQNRIGGILADDMGLGKTVQALALIAEAAAEEPTGIFLVVAPTSVVANWVNEARKFVPDVPAVAVTSTEAKSGVSFAERIGDATIVVTSYTLLRLQFDKINEFRWTGVIFDEAQFVKNHNSKTHQCARRLGAEVKIAITGTPMENNLMELWALLSLTAPGLFPSPKVFGEYFRKPIESGQYPERLAKLRQRIRPVMLRRTKDQVVAELPAKQEQVVALEMTPKHDKIYQTRLNRERQKVLGLLGDWDENRFAIFRSLTMLRQLSLHAGLVEEEHHSVASAKIDYLSEQLPELISEGHAALVFSQFTGFLGLVRERLDELGIAHSYLDGSMNAAQRARAIEEFTSGDTKVFLISLKAGGFGLNLTEADYCFVCDPWWNPAAEAQAVDRAHRIGQTRPVTVYRLVSAGTIEEKVVELQDKKRKLFDAVVDDGDLFGTVISADDVRSLLGDSD